MFVKARVCVNMMVEVDDKFQTLATQFATGDNAEYDAELADELVNAIWRATNIPGYYDVNPTDIGTPFVLGVTDMEDCVMAWADESDKY